MSIRIAAIGLSHNHIYNQVNALLDAGAEFISFYGDEPERCAEFAKRYPQAQQATSIEQILEDKRIQMVVSAAVPNQRAPLGVRVMQHGKDYSCAKPGFTSLEQLEEAHRVQAATGRIYIVHFGERIGNPATVKAGELVHSGAIGAVVQTVGFGPHRLLGHVERPAWTFDKQYFGGIINDLASHQIDQFLYFTGSTAAEIVSSQVGNFHYPQFPRMEDYGDLVVRSASAAGFIRVDWLTPKGLNTWGDVRLFILGTEGYIELRKNCDLAGRPGSNHLFLVDQQGTHYLDCA
ncbi:MAG: Gfo/Idh/MocA family oxidoreductase, partial [Anaerolineae bacterium]|nr:Gfo/Idh/MocA family oxidoreductase [Anaerolineae bacterium]